MPDEQSRTPSREIDALTWGEPPSPSLFEATQLPPEEMDENESMPSLETVSDIDSEMPDNMAYGQSRTPSPNPSATPYDEFDENDAMTWVETPSQSPSATSRMPYDDFYGNEYVPSPEPHISSDSDGESSDDSVCAYCSGDVHQGSRASLNFEPEGDEEEEGTPSRLTPPRWEPPRYRY